MKKFNIPDPEQPWKGKKNLSEGLDCFDCVMGILLFIQISLLICTAYFWICWTSNVDSMEQDFRLVELNSRVNLNNKTTVDLLEHKMDLKVKDLKQLLSIIADKLSRPPTLDSAELYGFYHLEKSYDEALQFCKNKGYTNLVEIYTMEQNDVVSRQ